MRPGPWLLTAAAVLAAAHVTAVLFARPLWRPAELASTLCLLAYAITYDLLPARRSPAPGAGPPTSGPDDSATSGPGSLAAWGLSAAAATLVAGAALTVPPAPTDGAGLQFLSSEEYTGLLRHDQLADLIPVTTALIFVVMLLVTLRRSRGVTVKPRPLSRTALITGAAWLLIVGYALLRTTMVLGATPVAWMYAGSSLTLNLPAVVLVPVPLALALAAAALAVITAAGGRWRVAAGALLFAMTALISIDAVTVTQVAYEFSDDAPLLSLHFFGPTDAIPQPMQALTAALHLTAAILIVTGLARRTQGS